MSYEYWPDEHTLFTGDILTEDDSFDHAFGTEHSTTYEVQDFGIIVFIDGIDHDVTSSIKKNSPEMFQTYKDRFLAHYLDGLE